MTLPNKTISRNYSSHSCGHLPLTHHSINYALYRTLRSSDEKGCWKLNCSLEAKMSSSLVGRPLDI
ncbi:hypothetical protein MTR_4g020010 [Medicago truncatula]|uniref:Uncharacterized protein n=1 Tax=Medicago truncatula TaxID=3880 RepID=A0A072USY5_MEDTR|nr:hypothetical protein MTR_4g020010 [Medicago truncatula]